MLRIAVLISGRGSNLRSLVEKARDYEVAAVISNRADAAGLAFAKKLGINTVVVPRELFTSLSAQKEGLLEAVRSIGVNWIALAGFMQIIPPSFLAAFPRGIVNIHPSLLPKYPGLDTHARAIAGGETEHGCTVHLVDEGVDTGRIIAQAACACSPVDDAESLAARVLQREHEIYPWVLNNIACGDIVTGAHGVTYSDHAKADAAAKHFRLPTQTNGATL